MKLYIGTYTKDLTTGQKTGSQGIYLCEFDDDTGLIEIREVYGQSENPSFLYLSADGRLLLAANECLGDCALDTYSVGKDGALVLEDTVHFPGNACCYAALDDACSFAVAVNYGDGEVFSYSLQDGHFGQRASTFFHHGAGPVESRQERSHTHSAHIMPGQKAAVVCDLGCDLIRFYGYKDGGMLTERVLPDIRTPEGSGPRHSEFAADGKHLYVSCELSNEVLFYELTEQGYALRQRLSTLPEDFKGENTVADIHMSIDKRCLYVSNRGHDSIACYQVETNGCLERKAIVPCGGKTPRNFAVTERHLLCANQDSGTVSVLPVGADGIPGQTSFQLEIPAAVCVELGR